MHCFKDVCNKLQLVVSEGIGGIVCGIGADVVCGGTVVCGGVVTSGIGCTVSGSSRPIATSPKSLDTGDVVEAGTVSGGVVKAGTETGGVVKTGTGTGASVTTGKGEGTGAAVVVLGLEKTVTFMYIPISQ
jgi:hypothetical protein